MSMHFGNPTTPATGTIPKASREEPAMASPPQSENPPCVVGMACRVPGASAPSRLWDNIINKVDLQSKMPEDRFNVDAFYHPKGTNKGTTNAKYGYFLDQDLGLFDAGFFNISGKEAEAMDPQQRLLLEVVYEALEDAGITLDEIQGSLTSVYCGCFTNDYNAMTTKDLEYYPKYTVTGTGNSILANRISYFYNLHGPSATVDTACSSSLVCFHLGAQSLRNAEADISIVVGSALHFDPNIFITMTDLGMLSTDGRCRHGDAAGSGYVRGEGIAAMILKRQSRAQADGDNIRAVVRGTGVNHDGRKQGITLPSAQAQADLIKATYERAGLEPADTAYVECHGTGTKAGDPRELRAIHEVFSRDREDTLYVGSVKTNIGHLEGASGIAGLMKATMALEKNIIPPNMHFSTPNPEVDFKNWKLEIPTEPKAWEAGKPRRVSINSFGYGGTNAHVILEEYASSPKAIQQAIASLPIDLAEMVAHRPYLLPLTSHSERGGELWGERLATYLTSTTPSVADVAFSLSTRRTMHRFRSFAVAADMETLIERVQNPLPVASWKSKLDTTPRIGFVFTGQGAQWFAMGRSLIEQSPLFLQTLQKCDRIFQALPSHRPDWSVVAELQKSQSDTMLSRTEFSQPICTAVQLALIDVLAQWGIKPSGVVGHSSGELAATYAAGLFSFENALVAAYYRGVHMGSGAAASGSVPGAMMAVGMTEAEVTAELEPYVGRIAIAAMNSPSSFTVSGDEDAVVELQAALTERKVFARRLQVAQAFHSHHMFPLAPGYKEALAAYPGFKANKERSAIMVSSVTGRLADPETLGPDYLAANMTGMVRFSDALTELVLDEEDQQRIDVLVEIGPHPALKGPSNQTLDQLKLKLPYFGTLDRKQDAYESLLSTAGQLFALGYPVNLEEVNKNQFIDTTGQTIGVGAPEARLQLPSYAWDHHERYWGETRVIKEHRLRPSRHSILGARVPGSLETRPRWRNHLRVSEIPWLPDHSIDGKTIFPAAGYINMAIEAAATMVDGSIREFELIDVSVKSALVVSEKDVGTETIVELAPAVESAETSSSLWKQFTVLSVDENGNQREHCTGMIRVEPGSPEPIKSYANSVSVDSLRQKSFRSTERMQYYHRLHSIGLQYGPTFQLVAGNVESGDGIATAPISWKPALHSQEDADQSIVHPALLDSCLHPVFASIEGKLGNNLSAPYVPTFIRSLRVSGLLDEWKGLETGFESEVVVETNALGPRTATNDLRLHSSDGGLLLTIQGLKLTSLGSNAPDDSKRSLFFQTQWKPMFTGLEWSPEKEYDLTRLVELYVHQHPNSKILHVTSSASSTDSILPALRGIADSERRNIGNLVILPVGGPAVEDFDAIVDRGNGLVSVVEATEDTFDLVILSADIELPAISERVAENGFLVVLDPTNAGLQNQGLHQSFASSDLQVWQKKQSSTSSHADTLTIVMPSQPTAKTRQLADLITSQRQGPTVECDFLSLINSSSDIHGDVVVLASLDSRLFFDSSFDRQEHFQAAQALLTKEGSGNIVWLTRKGLMDVSSPEQALILGLARTARSENPDLRLVVFDIDPSSDGFSVAKLTSSLLDASIEEDEIAERGGLLYVPRVIASDDLNSRIPNGVRSEATIQPLYQKDRPLALRIGRPGLLDTLTFSDDTELTSRPLRPDELEIEVKASALNFRDIAASMGIIDDFKLGDECAGVVVRVGSDVSSANFAVGDRVVAWCPGQGAHRTILRNPACLCYRLQGQMPFSIASSIPLVLTTAYYSLVDTARLQPGETILIHSAAGGVGQMAIQIAQNIGATVIATVGSAEKRAFLIKTYGLEDSHILSSRDDSFVEGIRRLTNGRGVDVVLNSLAGPLLLSTWASLAPFGRFVEIGKRDIHQNSRIPMEPFRRNVSFASVDMITVFERNQVLGTRVFQESCALVHEGKIMPPQPITEVSYAEVQRAFRMLQTGTTSGKIVLMPGADDRVLVEQPRFRRRLLFDAQKTYLLVGGLGGLGRRLSEWLFQRGARHLAFLSRSGTSRPEARETVEWLEARGVEVKVFSGDVTNATAVNDAVGQIEASGNPLAGVFQAAMVLQDAPLAQMSFAQWQRCMAPKVQGTWNLHNATATLALDFFVCFSSVSGVLGSKGQANYSAANCYLDALCAYRRSLGLVGTTMNVGMVVGVGAVSEDAKLQTVMERIGYDAVNEEELFAQIDAAVSPVGAEGKLALVDAAGRDAHQIITGVNLRRPTYFWANEPRFRNLYANHDFDGSGEGKNKKQDVMSELREAPDEAARVGILTLRFLEKIAAVLSVDQSTLQPNRSLGDYGLDSIVAIEIRQWFYKTVGVELAMFDILNSRSILALIEKVASVIVLTNQAEATAATNTDVQSNSKGAANGNADAATSSLLPAIAGASMGNMSSTADIPMSSYQRRMWFMHNISADPSFLNLPTVFRLQGKPDATLVQRALEELKRRNEILRTAYSEGEEFSQQTVMDKCTIEVLQEDFSSNGDVEESLNRYVSSLRQVPMDIEDGEVMKAALVKLSENRHALILILHHICIDRGSSQSFLEQFTGLYQAMRKESNLASVAQPAVSYGEFSVWHNALLQSSEMQPSLAFWKSVYEDKPATAMQLLPFAKADRPETNDYQRHIHRTSLKKTLLQRMKRICSRLGVTPAQFLMAGLRGFLYRYTEEEDLTIHLVDGNRPHPAVNNTLGFFVNVVPVRSQVDHSATFDALLRQVKGLAVSALQHSQLPFDAIVDAVGAARTSAHFPLGQVILNYQVHGTMPVYPAGDFDITEVQGEDIPTACELGLEALEDPNEGLKLRLEYSSTLYGEDEMARFLDNFVAFLSSAIHDYRQPVSEVSMVGSKELEFLKASMFNLNFVPNTWDNMSVSERILAIAREYPQEIAVESSDNTSNGLTYASLVAHASDIARAILNAGIAPASKIGIHALPGPAAIASMVGVLFAGCGYVALDPDFAKERLAFMIEDSGARLVLADDRLEESTRALSTVPVLATGSIPRSGEVIDSPVPTEGSFPFYTIYTSGSTGTPKGVVLSQSNTQQMLSTLHQDYRFSSEDRFLHQSSISFDLSIVQIFSALTAGARVCVADAETRKDPLALATYMEAAQVSVTYFTPTQFALLIEDASKILKKMANYRVAYFAGEKLPVRVAKAFYDLKTPATLYNTWSPSELVVQTTIQSVEYPADDTVNIPIGFPMANTRHYILDSKAKPLPMGVVGEIVVGGAQVGLGYINRPEINERAFLSDPFCSEEDHRRGWGRMFRTGDKGRFLPGGNLEFHGRIAGDKQVKLRGYRIDLGEVEQRIFVEANKDGAQMALVDLAVIAREVSVDASQASDTDDRQLIAFVVPRQALPRERQSAFAFQLNEMAGKYLNPYMLPSAYQFMEKLPTTIGGKVDLQTLLKSPLDLAFPINDNGSSQTTVEKENNDQDEAVLDAVIQGFRQLLKLPATRPIGPDDSFFALGGNSLLLMRLQTRLKRTLKLPLPLNAMLKTPTPAAITQLLTGRVSSTTDVSQQPNADSIDWEVETKLAEVFKPSPVNVSPSQINSVLLTGVDSFIGVHMLATLLEDPSIDNIYVLGSQKPVEVNEVYESFDHYHLSSLVPSRDEIELRVHCLPGNLVSPQFGLSTAAFRQLGRNIQSIYHLGGYVSLLRSYDVLRESNVSPVHSIIQLASLGRTNTPIHHLSTWSVPHLQTWSTTTHQQQPDKGQPTITAAEISASHFTPESSDRLGYFKSRWAAEMIMEKAAERGFAVTIYRASAATADRRTGVPEPKDDFIRTMILNMIHAKAIPALPARQKPFVVDFVPVDYITRGMHAIAMREAPSQEAAKSTSIYHLSNPQPLAVEDLPAVMEEIGGERGQSLPVNEWFEAVGQLDTAPEAQVRWAVLKEYFDLGHLMFGLDTAKTQGVLETLGMESCQSVGVEYLRTMLERET